MIIRVYIMAWNLQLFRNSQWITARVCFLTFITLGVLQNRGENVAIPDLTGVGSHWYS